MGPQTPTSPFHGCRFLASLGDRIGRFNYLAVVDNAQGGSSEHTVSVNPNTDHPIMDATVQGPQRQLEESVQLTWSTWSRLT